MKVSDAVVKFFDDKGIKDVFCISGGGCIHLVDSLRKESNIKTICAHHEQALLMAAEGYTRLSNKVCASIVTTGPGGTNAITGLLGMWTDSIPSMIISGQVSKSQLSRGTGCRQIGDQEYDILKSVSSMTKYCVMIEDPNSITHELEKAYKIATSGRPGPVWIDIPLDVQAAQIDEQVCEKNSKIDTGKSDIGDRYINKVLDLISKSKKPLFIVGNGVRLSDSYELLSEILNNYEIPAVTGPHSGVDCLDNTYKYYAGRIGILGQLTSNKIVQESDLLICLGTRLPVKMTGYDVESFSPKSKKVIVDIDENEINKHKFDIDIKINADLNSFLNKIKEKMTTLQIDEWRKQVISLRSQQRYFYPKHENLKEYTSFYYFTHKANKHYENYPIVTSNGTAHVVTLQMYNLNKDQRLFTNVGCASMGYGLPAAIGASIASKNGKVVCIEGDGSIMMNLQELQTVSGYGLPIKIILINNEGYLSIKMTQESFFNGQEFASGPDSGVSLPNMKDVSNAFGIDYYSIKNNSEIDQVMNEAMITNNPSIIEVFTHPFERHEPKVTHKGIGPDGKIIPGQLTDMSIREGF